MVTAIGMVKNSADIIESYIRCNAMAVDNFVLLNNMCTDRTVDILKSLIEEGYKIEIIDDNETAYLQSAKMTWLMEYVLKNYSSDYIIPLDDDEIITMDEENKDLHQIIEGLNPDMLYYIQWRNYIPTEEDDIDEISIPKRLQYCFSDELKTWMKIIIPRKIAETKDAVVAQGNHDLLNVDVERAFLEDVHLAHYPCRSEAQIISKALIGWTNYLALPQKNNNMGSHWKKIYDLVKSNERINIELMWEVCMMYLDSVSTEDLKVIKLPIVIDQETLKTKYTNKVEIDPWMNYIYNTESLALKYAKMLNESMQKNK